MDVTTDVAPASAPAGTAASSPLARRRDGDAPAVETTVRLSTAATAPVIGYNRAQNSLGLASMPSSCASSDARSDATALSTKPRPQNGQSVVVPHAAATSLSYCG